MGRKLADVFVRVSLDTSGLSSEGAVAGARAGQATESAFKRNAKLKGQADVDTAKGHAALKGLNAAGERFERNHFRAEASVSTIEVRRGFSGLIMAGLAVAPALVPVMAATSAAVAGLAASLTAAAGAGGVFGLSMGAQIKAMTDAQKEIETVAKALQGLEKGTDEYAEKAKELEHLQKNFNAVFGEAAEGVEIFKNAWGDFLEDTSDVTLGVMHDGLEAIADVLPQLVPISNAAGKAVGGLIDEFDRWARVNRDSASRDATVLGGVTIKKDTGFEQMMDWLTKEGPRAITSFGHILADFGAGLGGVIQAFTPFSHKVTAGLENMARGFKRWGQGLSESEGFDKFMRYVNRVGPEVLRFFREMATTLGHFLEAIAPLARIQLRIFTDILEWVNELPPADLRALSVGFLLVAGGIKAVALASSIMLVTPIGAAVTSVALLATAFYGAYQKSKTFRTFIHKYLIPGIRDFASEMLWAGGQIIEAFHWIGDKAGDFISAILHNLGDLDEALGGVLPGNIKGAAEAFDRFRGDVGDDMLAVSAKLKDMSRDVLDIPDPKLDSTQARNEMTRMVEHFGRTMGNIDDEQVNVTLSAHAKAIYNALGGGSTRAMGQALLASGGPVRGPGTETSDSIPARLSHNEHVWSAQEVRGAGGHEVVKALRGLARKGNIAKVGNVGNVQRNFAIGGPVVVPGAREENFDRSAGAIGSFLDRAAYAAGKLMSEQLNKALTALSFGNGVGNLGSRGSLTPAEIVRGQQFARAQFGKPYIWGGSGPAGYDCSGFMGSTLLAATGNNPYQRLGTTETMPWAGFSHGTGTFTIFNRRDGSGGDAGAHMAGAIGGMGIEAGNPVGGLRSSTASFPERWRYDRGGILPSGRIGMNMSGSPERVLSGKQTRDFERLVDALSRRNGGGTQRFVLDVGGGRTLSGWIQDEIHGQHEFENSMGRMG